MLRISPLSWIACLLLAPARSAASSTQCWRVVNNQLTSYNGIPCGVVTSDSSTVACCNTDSLCLQNNICQTIGGVSEGYTGYYTAGCTDSSYLSQSCSPYCKNLYRADIVYNSSSQLWACCGTESDDTTVNCSEPTDEQFEDPAPSELAPTFTALTATVTGPATSSSASSTTLQTSSTPISSALATKSSALPLQTNVPQPISGEGLSIGAKVGIGVAAPILVLGIGALLFLYIRRKRRTNHSTQDMPPMNNNQWKEWAPEIGGQQKPAEIYTHGKTVHEMDTQKR